MAKSRGWRKARIRPIENALISVEEVRGVAEDAFRAAQGDADGQTEADWWREDAARLNRMAEEAHRSGKAIDVGDGPGDLNEGGVHAPTAPGVVIEAPRVEKGKGASERARKIREEAEKVPLTEEKVVGEEVGRRDYDAIEREMTPSERGDMEEAENEDRSEWADRMIDDYNPDDDLDRSDEKQAAKDAGWSDEDVAERAKREVKEALDEDEEEEVEAIQEQIGEWYATTRKHGAEAVDELIDRLENEDADPRAVRAIEELRSEVLADVEEAIDRRREELSDAYRDSIEERYDNPDFRSDYLADFYDNHSERFGGGRVEGRWGVDEDEDRAYAFSTTSGSQYRIWGRNHSLRIGNETLPIMEVGFSDEKGSYAITGAGSAYEVFSKVSVAVTALALKGGEEYLSFTAAEESRQKLYDRLVRTTAAAVPEFVALAISKPIGKRYILARRDKLDYLQGVAKAMGSDIVPEILINEAQEVVVGPWVLLTPEAREEWFHPSGWEEDFPTSAPDSPGWKEVKGSWLPAQVKGLSDGRKSS